MLYISFYERQPHEIANPNNWITGKPVSAIKAFEYPIAKEIVKDIDGAIMYAPNNIESPYLGYINLSMLSTGVKNLMIGYHTGRPIDGCRIGDNCWPWLIKLAETRDMYVSVYGMCRVPSNIKAKIVNKDKFPGLEEIENKKDFVIATLLYREKIHPEWYTDREELEE